MIVCFVNLKLMLKLVSHKLHTAKLSVRQLSKSTSMLNNQVVVVNTVTYSYASSHFQLLVDLNLLTTSKVVLFQKSISQLLKKVVKKRFKAVFLQDIQLKMLKLHFLMVATTKLTHLKWHLNLLLLWALKRALEKQVRLSLSL